MALKVIIGEVEDRIAKAQERYGDFASTHEVLGVACEEWHEIIQAVHSNRMAAVESECLDLAAVLIRFANNLRTSNCVQNRSVK